mgnify:FL=1
MSKVVKIVISLVVVVSVVVVGTVVYKNYDSPKSTIEKFEDSYNSADMDGMIECFDPSVQALYSGANSILSDFIGMDIGDLSAMLPFLAEIDDSGDYSYLPKIDISVLDVDKTSDTTATVLCEFTTSDGVTEEDTIEMVKIDGEWYISGEEFYSEF